MAKLKIISGLFIITLLLYSCNNNQNIAGTWKIIGIEQIDSTIKDDKFSFGVLGASSSENIIYEFNENGEFVLKADKNVYNKGTYTVLKDNNTIELITTDGIRESLKYSLKNDKLILEETTGNSKITLQK
jgi:hypothetical protein